MHIMGGEVYLVTLKNCVHVRIRGTPEDVSPFSSYYETALCRGQ